MRPFRIRRRVCGVALTILLIAGSVLGVGSETSVAYPRRTQQQGKPVTISITPYPKVITQGEPLTLRYRIENHWDREVMVNLGLRNGDWLDISLTRTDGSLIQAAFLKPYGKWHPGGNAAIIRPEQYLKEERVIPRWETPPPPGDYQLRVRVQLPYAATAEIVDGKLTMVDDELVAAGKKSLYKTTLLFPVTVTPADSARLTKVANDIKAMVLTNQANDTLRERLFALPAAYYRPVIAELAQTPNLELESRRAVCEQLRLQKDAEAANLLAAMAWEIEYPKVGESEKFWQSHCIGALGLIYQGGDAALKSHVAALFARHQTELPAFFKTKAAERPTGN